VLLDDVRAATTVSGGYTAHGGDLLAVTPERGFPGTEENGDLR
jgi:hypothetical protein